MRTVFGTFPALQMRLVLWAALLTATAIYAMITFVVPKSGPPDPVLLLVLGGAAASSAVMSFVMPALMLKRPLAQLPASVMSVPDPNAESMFRDTPKTKRVFDGGEQLLAEWARVSLPAFIITLALRESVALMGIVLHVVGFDRSVSAAFIAAGALLIALELPTRARLVAPLERHFDAKLEG